MSLKAPKNTKPEARREQSKCPATIELSTERDRKVAYPVLKRRRSLPSFVPLGFSSFSLLLSFRIFYFFSLCSREWPRLARRINPKTFSHAIANTCRSHRNRSYPSNVCETNETQLMGTLTYAIIYKYEKYENMKKYEKYEKYEK